MVPSVGLVVTPSVGSCAVVVSGVAFVPASVVSAVDGALVVVAS